MQNAQNVTFTQRQQQMFVAQLQHDGTTVHGVEERSGDMLLLWGALMMAHTDTGCAYTDGKKVLLVVGEQQQGEVYLDESYVGEYSTDGVWLKLHLEEGYLCYEDSDSGWDDMARNVLDGEYNTMDLC